MDLTLSEIILQITPIPEMLMGIKTNKKKYLIHYSSNYLDLRFL